MICTDCMLTASKTRKIKRAKVELKLAGKTTAVVHKSLRKERTWAVAAAAGDLTDQALLRVGHVPPSGASSSRLDSGSVSCWLPSKPGKAALNSARVVA